MILRRAGQEWKFVTEEVLEDFVWNNLEYLLNLTPLKRQYFVKGEVCDILAIDSSKRLVILELKNSEDRYVVQQLTRYFNSLVEESSFEEDVDCSQPIHLVAIAPSFHKHNYVDRKYINLSIEFLRFEILQKEQAFYLKLVSTEGKQVSELEIPYRQVNLDFFAQDIPTPPQIFLEWLGSYTSEQQEAILKIRQQILSCDQRIREMVSSKNIKYGRSRKICAEFCFKKKLKEIKLFLWLRIPNYQKRRAVGRMQINTTDWSDCLEFAHVPQGISEMRFGRDKIYRLHEEDEWVRGYLDELVDEALETWLGKL